MAIKIKLYATSHAKERYKERYKKELKDFEFPDKIELFKDHYHPRKFYFNLEDSGFLVLKRDSYNEFVIVTVTLQGRIDDREFIIVEADYLG